jgi:ATP-dependent DNA helicase RecQ
MTAQPLDVLRQYWGHSAFRPLQEDIVRAVLEGQDALALLPTGGGKSICFQIPTLCQEGICIVVSPLIALMKDQVQNLQNRGISAAAIYSGMQHRQIDIIFDNAVQGGYKFLYVSPERLQTDMAKARIGRMNVCLLAVDEAHCISQWGYDFRPPYLQIAELRQLMPTAPVLALTATATEDVVKDIQEKLQFRQTKVFRQSFLRPNLSYSVLYEHDKRRKLLQILQAVRGTGIVYVRSRGETKEVAHFLTQNKVSADFYHAGLPHDERSQKQEDWIAGKTRVIVCTNAFGMGIDKPDVRIVVHLGLPDTLEAYFQEAGRAGRDGQKSYATLLYADGDGEQLRTQLQKAFPPMTYLRQVYQAIGAYTQMAVGAGVGESFDFDFQYFCNTYKLEHSPTHAALKLLEQEGWISISDAAVTPARCWVTADRETLYDYQIRNKQADIILKVLLRAYPGIQSQAADVSESLIAKYAKTTEDAVRLILAAASGEGILEYTARSEKPQLVFTRERVFGENLTIDHQKFALRKERAIQRLDQAIHYAERLRCRSKMLLGYFDEHTSAACGLCDVCTGRNAPEISAENQESYTRKVLALLQKEPLSPSEIMESFPSKRHKAVASVLQYLLDEGEVLMGDDGKIRSEG